MAARTEPPFRADHVGSLLRPPEVFAARDQRSRGEISAEQLRAVEDEAIRDVVKLQRDVGLQTATDGVARPDCNRPGSIGVQAFATVTCRPSTLPRNTSV